MDDRVWERSGPARDDRANTVSSRAWMSLLHVEIDYAFGVWGVPSLILKGLATDRLLGSTNRAASIDVDVLVPPDHLAAALCCLADRGFSLEQDGLRPGEMAAWSADLIRVGLQHADRVDLHLYLPGVGSTPGTAFGLMTRRTEEVLVAGRPLRLPDSCLSALIVVLHAARSLPGTKPRHELIALARVFNQSEWLQVRDLAQELDALAAMRVGLQSQPETENLVEALGLTSVVVPLHVHLAAQPVDRVALQLAEASTVPRSRRLSFLAEAAWPSPQKMRLLYPSHAHGRAGLATAYLLRTADLVRRTPRAVSQLLRARRQRLDS